MCSDCFEEDETPSLVAPEDVTGLARQIEAEMFGQTLTGRDWAIYLGQESGSLGWKSLERIGRAMDAAWLVATLAVTPKPSVIAGAADRARMLDRKGR